MKGAIPCWITGLVGPVQTIIALPWMLQRTSTKYFFSSLYTILILLFPSPSMLSRQPCWSPVFLVCVFVLACATFLFIITPFTLVISQSNDHINYQLACLSICGSIMPKLPIDKMSICLSKYVKYVQCTVHCNIGFNFAAIFQVTISATAMPNLISYSFDFQCDIDRKNYS